MPEICESKPHDHVPIYSRSTIPFNHCVPVDELTCNARTLLSDSPQKFSHVHHGLAGVETVLLVLFSPQWIPDQRLGSYPTSF